jgi:endogenous inhibitor of DNA gyrase (YacG/DUF329 family)
MGFCPICSRPAAGREANPALPFCSKRCKQIDLGKWLSEGYRVPVPFDPEADDGAFYAPAVPALEDEA